jgi:septum formation protein
LSDPVPAQFWERARAADVASLGFSGLVLASRSPQRKMLLEQLHIPFRIVVSDHAEGVSDGDPAHTVQQNARGKAEEVLARSELRPGELVLGVDTVVVSDGDILGKARDEAEAAGFVRRLAGRRHEVYSGLYLTSHKVAMASHAITGVTFRSLTDAELAAYIGSGEWRERAGAYAIQGIGSALVAAVDGDYFNVVGLPVAELLRLLAGFGVAPFSWLPEGAPAS